MGSDRPCEARPKLRSVHAPAQLCGSDTRNVARRRREKKLPGNASIRLRSQASEFPRLVGCVEEFARLHALPGAERSRLLILLDELFTNVVNHGSGGVVPPRRIEVVLSLNAAELTIDFSDDGRPFDPLIAAPPDLDRPLADRPVGGLGLHILRSLVDHARYRRDGDRNRLVLTRAIAWGE
jgi:serine/threonine-protein kinase RsbW